MSSTKPGFPAEVTLLTDFSNSITGQSILFNVNGLLETALHDGVD